MTNLKSKKVNFSQKLSFSVKLVIFYPNHDQFWKKMIDFPGRNWRIFEQKWSVKTKFGPSWLILIQNLIFSRKPSFSTDNGHFGFKTVDLGLKWPFWIKNGHFWLKTVILDQKRSFLI